MGQLFVKQYNCYSCKKPLTETEKHDIILKKDGQPTCKIILCKECKKLREENK